MSTFVSRKLRGVAKMLPYVQLRCAVGEEEEKSGLGGRKFSHKILLFQVFRDLGWVLSALLIVVGSMFVRQFSPKLIDFTELCCKVLEIKFL